MFGNKLKIGLTVTAVVLMTDGLEALAQPGNLEVLDVKIDPIRSGKNVVHVQVQNASPQDQILGIDIRTEGSISNWQTQFPDTIKGSETKWIRHAYRILGPITPDTLIRLRFFDAGSAAGFDERNRWGEGRSFKTIEYSARDLKRYRADDSELKPASKGQVKAATEVLRQFQGHVKNKEYEAAWQFFTQDLREAHFQASGLEIFERCMEKPNILFFPLSRKELLALEPESVNRQNGTISLTAALKDERWTVNYVNVEGKWEIDSFERVDAARRTTLLAPKTQEQDVKETFREWQDSIRDEKYETTWGFLANSLRRSSNLQNDLQKFKNEMSSDEGNMMRTIFLNLQPVSVADHGEVSVLRAKHGSQFWEIGFIKEDGRWKMARMGQVDRGNWQQRLLPNLQKRGTKHFDIYYYKDSTAEKEIDQIAEQKDKGFEEICRFLGKDSEVRIRMILFEDSKTKYSETGHLGAGWAFGNTIVEIYNVNEKLDPYHETTHVLTRPYGGPPALFTEGFALYMSERLGMHALDDLGGGPSTIYERVRQLKNKGEWIPLEELLTYTDIGPRGSQPRISYPEAASFVKFLIDKYGNDMFLHAYRILRNSEDEPVQQQNNKKLEQIYNKQLHKLEEEWANTFMEVE